MRILHVLRVQSASLSLQKSSRDELHHRAAACVKAAFHDVTLKLLAKNDLQVAEILKKHLSSDQSLLLMLGRTAGPVLQLARREGLHNHEPAISEGSCSCRVDTSSKLWSQVAEDGHDTVPAALAKVKLSQVCCDGLDFHTTLCSKSTSLRQSNTGDIHGGANQAQSCQKYSVAALPLPEKEDGPTFGQLRLRELPEEVVRLCAVGEALL
mmetsp:Transcript_38947/g.70723  ORF Transcript_38947/g.70723 Transcript_38947/m.70723 type:complete len:210 (-) Transcript_38947:187-816(-)